MKSFFILFTLIILSTPIVHANEDYYFSGHIGVGRLGNGLLSDFFNNEGISYGLRGGWLLGEHFSVGFMMQKMANLTGGGIDVGPTSWLAEGTYYLSGSRRSSLWLSLLAGLSDITSDDGTISSNYTKLGATVGAGLGYNFFLGDQVSIGPYINYLTIDSFQDYQDFSTVSSGLNLMVTF